MDSFLTVNKMTENFFENLKILQNFGIKIESHHCGPSEPLVLDNHGGYFEMMVLGKLFASDYMSSDLVFDKSDSHIDQYLIGHNFVDLDSADRSFVV